MIEHLNHTSSFSLSTTPYGSTRSTVQRDHALLTPDSHIRAPLPGWTETEGIILISPQMGSVTPARFSQYLAVMEAGARAGLPLAGVERFIFVVEGRVHVASAAGEHDLRVGGYAFFPAQSDHRIMATTATRLNVFEKRYRPRPGVDAPPVVIGQEEQVETTELLGDPDLLLRTLLPNTPSFDMAVNIMHYSPGATLPMVEVHVMEHGLLMLQGQGIQRLADSWYPVAKGDVIWMASYCPQWFAGIGKEPARYLLYKDINRDPLADAVG